MSQLKPIEPSAEVLERNLRALSIASPKAAERIRRAPARQDVEFVRAPDGAVTASCLTPRGRHALASGRRPLEEAARIAGGVDVGSTPGVVALGFGIGHHAEAVARKLARTGVMLSFEPDVGLLRAVFERIDHSEWIRATNFALLTDAEDPAAISDAIAGSEGVFVLGAAFVEHPACRARAGTLLDAFSSRFTNVMRAARTSVLTTLVQSEATFRNLLMNMDWYVSTPGVAELEGIARGRAAVVVSAGPSLERNIELLARPGVRDRVVIVAVQTVLKQLLARGIRPHFVCALDHHEISRRFYEGLTAEQVAGVTLVVEPRANPAILESFPGAIRCCEDEWLEDIIGGVVEKKGRLPAGATVAHLAYSLARHLGCDPVVMIGQDLGFTDGQYYSAGAAIHTTWGSELNPFRTLEMFEWERIARARRLLRQLTDVNGRPIYTDEQMAAYLVQFEQMFGADQEKGLRTIDATEGGVAKRHTTAMTLEEALARAPEPEEQVCTLDAPSSRGTPRSRDRIARARERVVRALKEAGEVGRLATEATELLRRMQSAYPDERRVNDLIRKITPVTARVNEQKVGFKLVQHINQVGTLNRFKADRAIAMDGALSPVERQKRQIERDIDNVVRIQDAARRVKNLLERALVALDGGVKLTRDVAPEETEAFGVGSVAMVMPRVIALIPVDPDRGSLGIARRLGDPVAGRMNALQLTLARLARSRHVRVAVLLTPEPERVREILGDASRFRGLTVRVEPVEREAFEGRRASVASARLFSPTCWRGGLAGLTVYDELLLPRAMARAMTSVSGVGGAGGVGGDADAAILLGPDWCAIDPELCDALIERHAEHPSGTRVTFTQAAPGLSPCLVARSMLDEFTVSQDSAQWLATIGASLGYIPIGPQSDPIAKVCCVPVEATWRDLSMRAIMDLPASRHALGGVLASYGENAAHAPTADIVASLAERSTLAPSAPQHLTLELCTGRLTSGLRGTWMCGRDDVAERAPIRSDRALEIIESAVRLNPAVAVTLAGAGDPLRHAAWSDIIRGSRSLGCRALHVRTDLLCAPDEAMELLSCSPGVVSVDLMATTRHTYRTIMGIDRFESAGEQLVSLVEARRGITRTGGLPGTWIVPRMTRCGAALSEVEPFYDHWLTVTGACVVDALPHEIAGERIKPLPAPLGAARRAAREGMTILCDGRVPMDGHEYGARNVVGLLEGRRVAESSSGMGVVPTGSIGDLFRALWRVRQQRFPACGPTARTLQAA